MITLQRCQELAEQAVNLDGLTPHLDRLLSEDPPCLYYRFLYLLMQEMKPILSVELGAGTGRGTAHMAAGWRDGTVMSIDPEKHGAFIHNTAPYPNIQFVCGRSDSSEILGSVKDRSVSVCFVDSVHAKDYVLKEVHLWTPKMVEGGVFCFDDLELDNGMRAVLPALPFIKKASLGWLHAPFGFGVAICEGHNER